MRKLLSLLSTLVVMSLMLSACGTQATTPPSTVQPGALLVYLSTDNTSSLDETGVAAALDEIGIPHDTLDLSAAQLTAEVIGNYPTIVLSDTELPATAVTVVTEYVQAGGGLVATGRSAHGLEGVLGISSISPKTIGGTEEVRFELDHPVSWGAYWNGVIMSTPPMPAGEIPAISQFLYPNSDWPAYSIEPSTATVIGHWYKNTDTWSAGQQEPAVVVNTYGQGRTVYSGALPGIYSDKQWPLSWQRISINAVEWTSADDYLVEIGYWPDANRAAFAWSGDTETPGMVQDVPTILAIFKELGLKNFGTFFLVGRAGGDEGTDGAQEHPDVAQEIVASGGEVGGHGDIHSGFSDNDAAAQNTRIAGMAQIINTALQPTGETLKGFRAPHVDFNDDTLQALADNGVLYDSSDLDVWSEAVLPNFNHVWELSPSMPMDWTLFEDTPVSNADATAIYKDKFEYFYANRAMFVWLNHPWVISDHLGVLQDVLKYAQSKGDVWMAREMDIAHWWSKRANLSAPTVTRSGDNIHISVTNNGTAPINGVTVWLRLPVGMNPASLAASLADGTTLETKVMKNNDMLYLGGVIPSIAADSSASVQFGPAAGGPQPTLTVPPTRTQIPPTATIAPPSTTTAVSSLSRGKPAFASSIESDELGPQYAVDGNASTRWGSLEGQDPQWFYVDLGESKEITRVKIAWEDSFAAKYEIQVSDDAQAWKTVYSTGNGQGGIEEIPISATARYVRMYGLERGSEWGYSIYEFDVYDASYHLPPIVSPTPRAVDIRSYQHGIDFLPRPDGKYTLVWSSSGNPPTGAGANGSWTHDIYYSLIDPSNPVIAPTMIISAPEAQEPSSAAISPNGHIFITNEDGYNTQDGIIQRYGVYDTNFAPILPYPQTVDEGAHSGHVTAVGNRFVVFYSNGWVDGGGVDNLGSGDNVLAKIYDSDGNYQQAVEVCVGQATRDWWPVLAGSSTRAALVWQRFVDDQTYADLVFSLLDPATGALVKDQVVLEREVKYYTYNVAYLPAVDRFLVLGAYETGGGFAYLLDNNGNVVTSNKNLPAIVRESHSIVLNQGDSALVAQVTAPTGLMVLTVTPTDIQLKAAIADDYEWRYSGTDGFFVNASQVYVVSLSENGLVDVTFSIP